MGGQASRLPDGQLPHKMAQLFETEGNKVNFAFLLSIRG
jgi:hypothetical protein